MSPTSCRLRWPKTMTSRSREPTRSQGIDRGPEPPQTLEKERRRAVETARSRGIGSEHSGR
jgi:hypothetical protein